MYARLLTGGSTTWLSDEIHFRATPISKLPAAGGCKASMRLGGARLQADILLSIGARPSAEERLLRRRAGQA